MKNSEIIFIIKFSNLKSDNPIISNNDSSNKTFYVPQTDAFKLNTKSKNSNNHNNQINHKNQINLKNQNNHNKI